MSGGEPSSIKRNVSCAAASLHTYVPDIFYFGGEPAMRFLRKFAAFWLDFSPWLLIHMLIFCLLGGYFGYDALGEQGSVYYYQVMLSSIVAALIFASFAYFAFGRKDQRYILHSADPFDKRRIYSCFSGKPASVMCEAVIDMNLNSYSEAAEKFKEIEASADLSDVQKAVLYYYLGKCYHVMGYPSNGIKYFRSAIDAGYSYDDVYLLMARCLVQNGSYEEAIESYNILIEKDCLYDFIYTDIGIAYLKKGDGSLALEYFQKSVAEGKNYAFALGGCSLSYLKLRDLEKSEEYYKKALACNMNDIYGFKVFYCNIAESEGLIDEINPNIRKSMITGSEILR